MRHNAAPSLIWTLLATCGLWLMMVMPSQALTWYWGSHPDKERIVFDLGSTTNDYALERTGRQTLTLTLPSEAGALSRKSGTDDTANASYLAAPAGSGRTFSINTRTPGFGYISTTAGNKIVIDIFPDPIGARWKPQANQQTAQPEAPAPTAPPKRTTPAPKRTRNNSIVEAPGTRSLAPALPRPLNEENLQEPVMPVPQATQQVQPAPSPADALATPTAPQLNQAEGQPVAQPSSNEKRSFFAVPYTYRSAINSGGPEQAKAMEPQPAIQEQPNTTGEGIRNQMVQAPSEWKQEAQGSIPPEALAIARSRQQEQQNNIQPEPAPVEPVKAPEAEKQPIPALQPKQHPQQVDAESSAQIEPPAASLAGTNEMRASMAAPGGESSVPNPVAPSFRGNMSAPAEAAGSMAQSGNAETDARNAMSAPVAPESSMSPRLPVNGQQEQANAAPRPQETPMQRAVRGAIPNVPPQADGTDQRFIVTQARKATDPYPVAQAPVIPQEEPKVTPEPIVTPPQDLTPVASNIPPPPEPKVQYVDKDGNPVPPPPDPKDLLFQARAAVNNGETQAGLDIFKRLKRMPNLTPEQREDTLYGIADATYAIGKGNLLKNYDKIINTITAAMNHNLKSRKVPGALLRLGLTNLKIGNIREAEAYFNILRRNHPDNDLIPITYYYWGDHHFKKEEWQKAADNFQYVVQNYPDSKFVREAGVGLARSLYRLGFYEQAFQIVDYVEKRWPRFYVEYPPFLNQMGDVAYRMEKYDKARIHYWTYYNIDPNGDEADLILSRLGDIYLKINEKNAARDVYEEAARKFPDKDGGLIALMRLAEEGVHDAPSISEMYSIFDRPYNLRPLQIYSKIIEDHPESDLAPLARLKKAMWYLWNKEYPEALSTATAFTKKHPNHELTEKVQDVAVRAFNIMVADNIQEENYERILQIWDQFPIVRGQESELSPESRIALGLSYSNKKQPAKALTTIDPFFQGLKVPKYSEMALGLALGIYLDNEKWDDILKLATRIELWELNQESQTQLDYARALALENIGQSEKAEPIWAKLRRQEDVPLEQEAYTLYFLTRDFMRKEDYENAFRTAQQSLRDFKEIASKTPEKADNAKIKDLLSQLMDITERTGRAKAALDWAKEYAAQITPQSPEYPGLRYRIARLYKKNANLEKWRSILTDLRDKNPDSLYGRMAASELRSHDLTEGASQFSPTGRL